MLILATKCVVKLIEFQCEGIALLSVNFHLLLNVFNKTFKAEIENISSDLKLAHIIPIFKSADKSSVFDYRPVPLLSTISKVFEKVVCKNIFNFLMENALIYKFQSGFLPGHSTTHQLIELINEIFMALDNRELICLIFCDVRRRKIL